MFHRFRRTAAIEGFICARGDFAFGIILVCLLFATGTSRNASAATLTVCSASELSTAISNAKPGDVVEMCDKTWSDTAVNFQGSGTQSNPITLRAQTPGGVVLTGSSHVNMGGSFLVVDGLVFQGQTSGAVMAVDFRSGSGNFCNDCRLTNVSIINYSPSSASAHGQWVRLWGKRNRVDHCYFKGKTNQGSMLQVHRTEDPSPNYHEIDHNLFEDRPNLDSSGTNPDTVEIGGVGKYAWGESITTFEYNYIRNIFSDYEAFTVKSSGNTIRYNVIEASRGVLSLRQGHGNLVQGNYILGRGENQSGGIRIQGKDHIVVSNYIENVNPGDNDSLGAIGIRAGNGQWMEFTGAGEQSYWQKEEASNVVVSNNTIVNSGGGVVVGYGGSVSPTDNFVSNNIIDGGSGQAIKNGGVNTSFSANFVFGKSAGVSGSGVRVVDPILQADSAGIWRPGSGSPVLDASVDMNLSAPDMDGQVRGSPADVGADEVVPSVVPRGVLKVCEVGPTTYRMGLPALCDGAVADTSTPQPPPTLSAD